MSSNGSCVAIPDTQSPQKIADFKGDLRGEDIAWASPCQAGGEMAQCGSYYLISIPYFWRYFNSWERFLFKVGRLHQRRPCTALSAGVGGSFLHNAPCSMAYLIHTSMMAEWIRFTFYSSCWNSLRHFFPSFCGARKFQKCIGGGGGRKRAAFIYLFIFWSML